MPAECVPDKVVFPGSRGVLIPRVRRWPVGLGGFWRWGFLFCGLGGGGLSFRPPGIWRADADRRRAGAGPIVLIVAL